MHRPKFEVQSIPHEEGSIGSEDEYEYTDSSSESEDIQIILNADDQIAAEKRLDQSAEGIQDGLVHIPDEDTKSAFDIDINKLKLRKWEMTGDESDYFNYGMNESMWKAIPFSSCLLLGLLNVKELRELSDNLIMQGSYLPYSSSAAHTSSRSYHSNYHDSTSLNQEEMEQFYSLINNPDTLKEVMKKINEQQDVQASEPRKEEQARYSSHRKYNLDI
ncbi:hypothetical protein JH06_3726 [Blastocystis sp. subtype 4]|uniref:hypothetical protein n=1 Tax=Blastocystis sp. subtype 4 TaxID=944170 RepID=UPI0007112BC0|nr:hypothetical protein JH06_3726 [Blastocystis sp. subtype 4]KNB42583.1 hypothetical protein JH06_3726 [Blastocystis sp. subtype 4]|eukprot:XP_014526026.1 hypothetical protein JH06_3726 [Blastocystis sp. subtype 4]